jgi:hypothetical protein
VLVGGVDAYFSNFDTNDSTAPDSDYSRTGFAVLFVAKRAIRSILVPFLHYTAFSAHATTAHRREDTNSGEKSCIYRYNFDFQLFEVVVLSYENLTRVVTTQVLIYF